MRDTVSGLMSHHTMSTSLLQKHDHSSMTAVKVGADVSEVLFLCAVKPLVMLRDARS